MCYMTREPQVSKFPCEEELMERNMGSGYTSYSNSKATTANLSRELNIYWTIKRHLCLVHVSPRKNCANTSPHNITLLRNIIVKNRYYKIDSCPFQSYCTILSCCIQILCAWRVLLRRLPRKGRVNLRSSRTATVLYGNRISDAIVFTVGLVKDYFQDVLIR